MRGETLVIVPMKDPARAKTRLAGALDPFERARFAITLFKRTLHLLLSMQREDLAFDLAVVSGNEEIKTLAAQIGIRTIDENPALSLSDALDQAASLASVEGYDRLCVIPADLAAPDPIDLEKFLFTRFGTDGIALSPSRDFGTNALLASPPNAIPFAYGPGSFHHHLAVAEARGLTPIILPLESLKWDIDTTDDLAEFAAKHPGVWDGAAHRNP
ncbi:MAG: 2-phospho-L-lactate guanylyltransferase [Pseudomonadota bacterium]